MSSQETQRLKALHGYRILDTEPEACFDDLSMLASQICDTPIALLTLVDDKRQWFKSKTGIDVTETPRAVAFCAHAIEQSRLLIVPDTLEDDRFRNNPLVVSEPGIRFYAGAPLITPEGHALGTLCVIDRKPRELSDDQLAALRSLRNQAVAQLELRRNLIELKQALQDRDAAEAKQRVLVDELQASLKNVKKLSSLIPFCSACKFDMTIQADPAAIDTLTEGVMQVLQQNNWVGEEAFGIEMALREALANSIRHGCKMDPSKSVQCCVTCDDTGEVLIVVRDPGKGFDEDQVPDPTGEANILRTSGRGIYLINELMDEVRYADGGREIQMLKRGSR